MTSFYGAASISENNAALGDGDETSFLAQGSFSFDVNLTIDPGGGVVGSGTVTGTLTGAAIGDTDGDDDGFSDFSNGVLPSLTAFGSTSGGVSISGSFGTGGYLSFSGTFANGDSSITGTLDISDAGLSEDLTTTLTLTGSPPAAVPTVNSLALLAANAYGDPPASLAGWTVAKVVTTASGLQIVEYVNADHSQAVLAFEGTRTSTLANFGSDFWADVASFTSGSPSADFLNYVQTGASALQALLSAYPDAKVTLTGHSLGGAVAQILGEASGEPTTVFNAPGAEELYGASQIQSAVSGLTALGQAGTGVNDNYRVQGDVVSMLGTPIGTTLTVVTSTAPPDSIFYFLTNHSVGTTVVNELNAGDATVSDGQIDSLTPTVVTSALFDTAHATVTAVSTVYNTVSGAVTSALDWLGDSDSEWIDPVPGAVEIFTEQAGSPLIKTVTMVAGPGDAEFEVWGRAGSGTWGPGQVVSAGQAVSFSSGVSAVKYEALTSAGGPVEAGSSSEGGLFYATFASAGVVSGALAALQTTRDDFNGDGAGDLLIENTAGAVVVGEASGGAIQYSQVAGLGSIWSFEGNGDFLGDGHGQFLIENTSGAVVVGDVHGGATTYSLVGGLGPEWKFRESGDFLADGLDDALIENTAGAVVVAQVSSSGALAYTDVGGLGPEWKFVGQGDFLADGHEGFLIENTSGAVVVGEVGASDQAAYTQVAALGLEWRFVATGDFLGTGQTEFVIENTAGAVVMGTVGAGNQAAYSLIGGLGTEWTFLGAGDFLNEGRDQLLMENTAGAVVVGNLVSGQLAYTGVSGLGHEWTFHQ